MSGEGFWRWFDRGARVDFGGKLLGFVFDWKGWIAATLGGGGGAMTFLKAAIDGRSPLDVWVFAVVVMAALVLIVYLSISILEKYKKSDPRVKSVPGTGIEQTRAVISISGPHILRDTRYKYQSQWRMKIHNAGPATAINPQMKLRSGNPGPNDAGWSADYPYPIARVGHTLDEPEYQINPGDDEDFEVVKGWKSESGQLFVTLSPKNNFRPITILPGERWNFSYQITSKNAPPINFTLQIFVDADEIINVVRTS